MTEALRWLQRARTEPVAVAAAIRAHDDPEPARVAALGLRAAGTAGVAALLSALDAGSPLVREVVLEVVALVPGPASLAALVERASDEPLPWLRRAIARAVARRAASEPTSAPEATDVLLRWAVGPDPDLASEALRGLREAGALTPERLEQIAGRNLPDAPPALRWQLAAALASCPVSGQAVLDLWREDPDPFVRAQVARARARADHPLRSREPTVPAEELLTAQAVESLRDGSAEDRPIASAVLLFADRLDALRAALGRLAVHQDATSELAQALAHPLPEIREIALSALDRRAGAQVFAAYAAAAAQEPEPRLRRAVLWTLGRRSEPETLDPLVETALGDPDLARPIAVQALLDRVRRSARARLPRVLQALLHRAADGTDAERLASIESLGRFAEPQAARLLDAIAQGPEPFAAAARESLRRIGPDALR